MSSPLTLRRSSRNRVNQPSPTVELPTKQAPSTANRGKRATTVGKRGQPAKNSAPAGGAVKANPSPDGGVGAGDPREQVLPPLQLAAKKPRGAVSEGPEAKKRQHSWAPIGSQQPTQQPAEIKAEQQEQEMESEKKLVESAALHDSGFAEPLASEADAHGSDGVGSSDEVRDCYLGDSIPLAASILVEEEVRMQQCQEFAQTTLNPALPSDDSMVTDFYFGMPEKLRNAGTIPVLQSAVEVQVNAYRMEMSKRESKKRVHQYRLEFSKVKELEDGKLEEHVIEARPQSEAINQERRTLLWALFKVLCKDPVFAGHSSHNYVYDCGSALYSLKSLTGVQEGEEKNKRSFRIEVSQLSNESRSYLGHAPKWICARLTYTGKVYLRGSNFDASSVEQFLDVLANQKLTDQGDFLLFKDKLFKKNSAIRVHDDPRIIKEGLQKGVRYVGDDLENAFLVLQIETKASAFLPTMSVLKYLDELLPGRGSLAERLSQGANFGLAHKELNHMLVVPNHLHYRKQIVLLGLSKETPDDVVFDYEGEPINVAGYFERRYSINLSRSRHLPCAVTKFKGKKNYLPLEVLDIANGQRVPVTKQGRHLQEAVLRQATMAPADFVQRNAQAKTEAHLIDSNEYFKKHDISISPKPFTAEGSVLWPPAITYTEDGRDRDEVREGRNGELDLQWNLRDHHYLQPATPPKVWVVIIFQDGVVGSDANKFLQQLIISAGRRGLSLPNPTHCDQRKDTDAKSISARFQWYKKHGVGFVMFFTKDKYDPVHDVVKRFELEYKIPTQHISAEVIDKALGKTGRGADMVKDNILLKTNLKLGGVNYGLAASQRFMEHANIVHDIVGEDWFKKGRMFIGLTMTRPGGQPINQRQSRSPVEEPATVGFAYTLGESVRLRGTFWYQDGNLPTAKANKLRGHVVKAMRNYAEKVGHFPHHLLIYRGAISEGDFLKVRVEEAAAFREAFAQLANEEPYFIKPKLTMIAVQRQNDFKVVPSRIQGNRAREQNVRAGTIVDRKLLHPQLSEFLLVAHSAIQGTSRPVRCTVMCDEAGMPLEELENISYLLCYAHGITLQPVSRPAPLYSAIDLVKRGRSDLRVINENGGLKSLAGEHLTVSQDLMDLVEPCIDTKFWA